MYVGRGGGGRVSPKAYRCIRAEGGGVNGAWYVCSLTIFLVFFHFEVTNTSSKNINEQRFRSNLRFILPFLVNFYKLHRSCIRLQVFITLYQSILRLWNSFNFMQLQAMRALTLNFRFVLVFGNSIIGVQLPDDDCRVLTYYVIVITYVIAQLRQHISI